MLFRSLKANNLRKEELENLHKELEEELNLTTDLFEEELKEIKASKDKKNEFKTSQVEHKRNQALAKVRKEFAEKEENLDIFYTKILSLIEKLEVGSILSEDEYSDLEDRELIFFEAKMGAEAIEKLLHYSDRKSVV